MVLVCGRGVFLSFGVDPLNWQSFIEIGEMACSTTVRCSRGHALKSNSIIERSVKTYKSMKRSKQKKIKGKESIGESKKDAWLSHRGIEVNNLPVV